MLRSSAFFAAVTLGAAPLAAQTAGAPVGAAPAGLQARAGAFVTSVGTDALARDAGVAALGVAAHAGYERRVGGPGSRFAVRLAGDYWRAGRSYTGDLNDGQGPLDVRRTTTLVGGSLVGVAHLPTLGAVRPYALAGAGVQQYASRNETDWVPGAGGSAAKVVYRSPVRINTASYTAGLGASAAVGRVTPFVEARATLLPGLGHAGYPGLRAPVTFGVRF
jgi:opacity protein-like surface antigen